MPIIATMRWREAVLIFGPELERLLLFRQHGDNSFDVGAAFVEDLGFDSFCGFFGGVALGFGHRFGVAEDHAGCATEDFADWPRALFATVFIGKEDLADALLLGAVVPAA